MPETRNSASAALLVLKPRQVMLAEHNTNTRKMQNKTLKPQQKALLLHSVVRYLQRNGFSKTLKRFLSEAQIENDNWKASSLDLEDLYCKYLDKRSHADPKFDMYKEQGLWADGTTEKDGNSYCAASEETIKKKKKKRSDESDSSAVEDQSEATGKKHIETAKKSEVLANDMGPESKVKSKGNKKSKKSSNSPGQIEQVKSGALEKHVDDTLCELQMDESSKKVDKKKKKSKLASESLLEVTEEKSKDLSFPIDDIGTDYKAEAKPKDKKKTKRSTDSLVGNVDHCCLADKQGMITDNLVSGSVLGNTLDIVLEEKIVKSKDTKGKKVGSVDERLSCGFVEVLDRETPIIVDSINECFWSSEETTKKDKKSSKKRKIFASDENECQPVKKEATEESKCRKVEGLEEVKNANQLKKGDLGKESKQGSGEVGQNGHQKPSKKQLVVDANANANGDLEKSGRGKTSINQLNEHANGNLEKNEGDKFAVQKTTRKQHNGSAEPKQVNAFQRVKIDDVVFADEKLQDNSYWAKDGAEVGYGAKAQEILGQVRGRDFRHEKTKKKRGSYRGGQIDLHSHSIKFNYSDED